MAGNSSSMTYRLFGYDVTASKAIRGVGDEADSVSKKLKDIGSKGLSPLMTAAATLGPALIPVLAGATVVAGGLGVSMAATGAATVVFAAVAKSAYTNIGAAAKTLTTAHDALAGADAKVTAAQYALSTAHTKTGLEAAHHRLALAMGEQSVAARNLASAQSAMTGPLGAAAAAQGRAMAAWKRFVDLNSPAVYAIFAQGFSLITAAIPKLEPLFKVAARAASELLANLGRFVTLGGLDRLVKFLAAQAVPAMAAFAAIAGNVAAGFGSLGRQFGTVSGGVLSWLVRLSAGFRDWATHLGSGGGFAKFIDYARTNGPAVMATFASIAVSLLRITAAVAPLAPLSLAVARGLSGIVNALPLPVLTGLIGGMLALNLAFKAIALSSVIAAAATKVWTAAQWLFDAAMTANPIGILIVTIAAFATALVLAYQRSETFRNVINGVFTWIKDHWPLLVGILIGPLGFAIAEMIKHWQGFTGFIRGAVNNIIGATRAVIDWFAAWPGFFERMWRDITGFFAAAGDRIASVFGAIVGWFQSLPGRILAGLRALPGLMWSLFTQALNRAAYAVGYGIGTIIRLAIETPGRIWNALKTLAGLLQRAMVGAWNLARSATVAGANAVVGFFTALPGRAARAVARLWTAIAGFFRAAAVGAAREASAAVTATISWLSQLPGRAASAVSRLWSAMSGAFRSAVTGAARGAADLVTGVIRWLSQLPARAASAVASVPGRIRGVFAGAGGWLISAGEDIIRGLITGIGHMAGAAATAAKNAVTSALDGAKHALGIGSPSKVFRDEVGRWIPPGIAAGIAASTPDLVGAVTAAMGAAADAAQTPLAGSLGAAFTPAGGPRTASAPVGGRGGETLVAQFYLDGKMIQESLLTLKRRGVGLGLA